MANSTKSISAIQVRLRVRVTEKMARIYMHKVRGSIKSCDNFLMDSLVHVDEFLVGGQEKGKIGRSYHTKNEKAFIAVQLTKQGKVIRMYIQKNTRLLC